MKKILLIAIVFVVGCTTVEQVNEIMDSWKGSHFSKVIASWGPPTQIIDDGKDGKILTWSKSGTMQMPGTATTNYNPISGTAYTTYYPGASVGWSHYKTFFADPNGIIYDWSWGKN